MLPFDCTLTIQSVLSEAASSGLRGFRRIGSSRTESLRLTHVLATQAALADYTVFCYLAGICLSIALSAASLKVVIVLALLSKRVIVTPAVYPRFIEFLHFDIQSTGQKSH